MPVTWKLLTGVIAEAIYQHLDDNEVLPWEQTGCTKGRRGTKDQLCIDKGIMKDCRRSKTNLAMAWVDYKKAYDIKELITQSMSTWRTKLESNGELLGEVSIKQGIFQGDSLSPLLFVMAMMPLTQVLRNSRPGYEFKNKLKINHLLQMDDLKLFAKTENDVESLINTVRIVSDDTGMQFGLSKCAVIALKRGKTISRRTEHQNADGEEFISLGEDGSYEYSVPWSTRN